MEREKAGQPSSGGRARRTFGARFFLSILIMPMVPKNCATWSSVTLVGKPLRTNKQEGRMRRR